MDELIQIAIETLVLQGYTILQIEQPNGNVLFFNVFKFQEGYFNTAQSIDFNTVEGIDITTFMKKNASMCRNVEEFIHHFSRLMDTGVVLRCEFSKNSVWYKWSSVMLPKGK